jgi:hypothetical protein
MRLYKFSGSGSIWIESQRGVHKHQVGWYVYTTPSIGGNRRWELLCGNSGGCAPSRIQVAMLVFERHAGIDFDGPASGRVTDREARVDAGPSGRRVSSAPAHLLNRNWACEYSHNLSPRFVSPGNRTTDSSRPACGDGGGHYDQVRDDRADNRGFVVEQLTSYEDRVSLL